MASTEADSEKLHAQVKFLAQYAWIYNFQLTRFFVNRVWEKIPVQWQNCLCSITKAELNDLPFGKVKENWPKDFQEFINSAMSFTSKRQRMYTRKPVKINETSQRGMTPKKKHEVSNMASLVDTVAKETGSDVIIDVGSGLGYLGQVLNTAYGYKVIGLESKNCHTSGADKRVSKQDGADMINNVTFELQDNERSLQNFEILIRRCLQEFKSARVTTENCSSLQEGDGHDGHPEVHSDSNFSGCDESVDRTGTNIRGNIQEYEMGNLNPVDKCNANKCDKNGCGQNECDETKCNTKLCSAEYKWDSSKNRVRERQLTNDSIWKCKSKSESDNKEIHTSCRFGIKEIQGSDRNEISTENEWFECKLSRRETEADKTLSSSTGSNVMTENNTEDGTCNKISCDPVTTLAKQSGTKQCDLKSCDNQVQVNPGGAPDGSEATDTLDTCGSVGTEDVGGNPSLLMIGLHCCGDLTPTMMTYFSRLGFIKGLCCVSCCYHRMEFNVEDQKFRHFPLSQKLKSTMAEVGSWTPDVYALRLAAQETRARWADQTEDDHQRHMKHVAYRGILEYYLCSEKVECGKLFRRIVKKTDFDSFQSYVDAACSRIDLDKLTENAKIEDIKEKLWRVHDEFKDTFKYIEPLTALQVLIQPIIEELIYADRLLWLQEHGHHMKIAPVFDEFLSPRNLALLATK